MQALKRAAPPYGVSGEGPGKKDQADDQNLTGVKPGVKEIFVTHWQDLQGQSKREEWTTWPEFCEWLACLPSQPTKEQCPLVKLARFGDKRSSRNSLRNDGNVLEVFGTEGDLDNGELSSQEVKARLEESNIRAIILTSWSHTPEHPRLRVFCPLSEPCEPEQRRLFVGRLNGALDGNLAGESFALSQSYFVGCNPNAESLIDCTFEDPEDGYCIDDMPELDEFSIFPALKEVKKEDVETQSLPKDEKKIRIAAARKDKKLLQLFKGEAETGKGKDYPSRSELDFALASKIAFYLGPDPAAIEELMRKSKIARDKWDKNDYLQRTILNVLARQKEVFQEPVPEAIEAKPDKLAFPLVQVCDLKVTPPEWLVKDCLEVDSIAQVFGDPGSGKSFFGIDVGCSVATGKDWHGKGVKQGAVIYLAGEGQNGLARRFRAWEIRNQESLQGIPLYCSKIPADLCTPEHVELVIQAIDQVAATAKPELVVVDTLARNFGPGDENNTKDMNLFISALDKIRTKYGSTILLVHHAGHGDKSRARGAMALKGALDAEYRMDKDEQGVIRFESTKMKDSEKPEPLAFRIHEVELDIQNEQGETATSAILDITSYEPPAQKTTAGRGKWQTVAVEQLREIHKKHQRNLEAGGHDPGTARVSIEEWRTACVEAGMGRRRWPEVKNSLSISGIVRLEHNYVSLS